MGSDLQPVNQLRENNKTVQKTTLYGHSRADEDGRNQSAESGVSLQSLSTEISSAGPLNEKHTSEQVFEVPLSTFEVLQHEDQSNTTQEIPHTSGTKAAISPLESAKVNSRREKSQMNAMGAYLSLKSRPPSPRGPVCGQSSIASLQQQVMWDSPGWAEATTFTDTGVRSSQVVYDSSTAARGVTSLTEIRRFSLPPRSLADHLLDCYWERVHLFYPWFHYPTFDAAYKRLWLGISVENENTDLPRVGLGGRDCSAELFHCALNTIFALGCEFSPSVSSGDAQPAHEFMEKVHELLQIRLIDDGLAAVQTLLLVTIYLQSTQHLLRCWGIAGLAVRMAQGIGLHLEANQSGFTVMEIEMRRRVWHGCTLMERYTMSVPRARTD